MTMFRLKSALALLLLVSTSLFVIAGCGNNDPNPKIEMANGSNTNGAKPIGPSAATGGGTQQPSKD